MTTDHLGNLPPRPEPRIPRLDDAAELLANRRERRVRETDALVSGLMGIERVLRVRAERRGSTETPPDPE
jgi:hypothetical protein